MRRVLLVAPLILWAFGCVSHHHDWERSDTSHEEMHRALEVCEAAAPRTGESVEQCMGDLGFRRHFAPRSGSGTGLRALPRLPGR